MAYNFEMFASSTTRLQEHAPNIFFGAHSRKGCPDSNLNHRCSSSRRVSYKPRDSRCENRSTSTKVTVRYCCTQQYSITALTDSTGAIKERYAYDAYGNLSSFDGAGASRSATAEGNRYTYTGREWDEELELYHYRARMYDAVAGRFLGRDPIGYFEGSYQLYRYVRNSPLIHADPSGLWDYEWEGYWEPWKKTRVRHSMERVYDRARELLNQIETAFGALSECQQKELQWEIDALTSLLECLVEKFESDDPLEFYLDDDMDPQVQGTGYPGNWIFNPNITFNDGEIAGNSNWHLSDHDLDDLIMHELAHVCGVDGHNDSDGGFVNPHMFQDLMGTDITDHDRWEYWEFYSDLKCNKDPRCEQFEQPYVKPSFWSW